MTVGLQIPIRWMAPEVLSGQPQYFYASDVWSMGVVVWQLLTRHAEPYPDVPDMMAVVHGYGLFACTCRGHTSNASALVSHVHLKEGIEPVWCGMPMVVETECRDAG